MISTLRRFVRRLLSAAGEKEAAELSYWKGRKDAEGRLSNAHYEPFYTTHFGLPPAFYAGKKVLDIGCGPRGSLEWADMAAERVGLDPLAEEYLKLGAAAHKMRYVAAPSEAIPFPDAHFDVVCSFNPLDHVADLDRTVAEIARVVCPGGLFLLLTDVNHPPTVCEPISYSWDVLDRFRPFFVVLEERRYEKRGKGMYDSIREDIPYDPGDATPRYGILSAKLQRKNCD
jgi:SAM-dependent methyltransferase